MSDFIFCDPTRDIYTCEMCGKLKIEEAYIVPSGVLYGDSVCKSCYEKAFGKQYGNSTMCHRCTHCGRMIAPSCGNVDSSGRYYCDECCASTTPYWLDFQTLYKADGVE